MVNYRINEAETIFEPYYDSGESYMENEKYSVLSEYTVTYAENILAEVKPTWYDVTATIHHQASEDYVVKMVRECDLDIRGFDLLHLYNSTSDKMQVRVCCEIDGVWHQVIESFGCNHPEELWGKISGEKITKISLEFRKVGDGDPVSAELIWMGLANEARKLEMESRPSPYTADSWKGCFVENPEIKPMIGIYFNEEEWVELKEKLKDPFYARIVANLREKAQKCMEVEPEPLIQEYITNHTHRVVRDRDMERPMLQQNMEALAFIGLLDENVEMLRMACRKMLSLAVTPHWFECVMGCLPGATWHRRCFTEEDICRKVAIVLDWAGSLLTWHGKNIVYDALMNKGLPRLESDFHSVEYIRHMNQGLVFNGGRVLALLALADRYPRYEARLQDAARDEREMVDLYVMDDGGTIEGPAYWNYTFSTVVGTLYLLARHEKKTLSEYAWDKLKKTGDFALRILSDYKDGTYTIPFNDGHVAQYSAASFAGFIQITDDPRWKKLYQRILKQPKNHIDQTMTMDAMLMLANIDDFGEDDGSEINPDGFSTLNEIGHTSLRLPTEDVGRVHCYLSGGPSIFAHSHGDRGQILLEVDHHSILIDRGICGYERSEIRLMANSSYHNLFHPEVPADQPMKLQSAFEGTGAKVVRSTYENGVFDYCTDTTNAWMPGIFSSITRSVKSEDPHLYLVYDDAVMVEELASSFRLNTRGEITQIGDKAWAITQDGYQITILPVNYDVEKTFIGVDGVDEHLDPVNQLRLYLAKAKEQHIITLLEVSKAGQQKAKVLSEHEIDYSGKIYTV